MLAYRLAVLEAHFESEIGEEGFLEIHFPGFYTQKSGIKSRILYLVGVGGASFLLPVKQS